MVGFHDSDLTTNYDLLLGVLEKSVDTSPPCYGPIKKNEWLVNDKNSSVNLSAADNAGQSSALTLDELQHTPNQSPAPLLRLRWLCLTAKESLPLISSLCLDAKTHRLTLEVGVWLSRALSITVCSVAWRQCLSSEVRFFLEPCFGAAINNWPLKLHWDPARWSRALHRNNSRETLFYNEATMKAVSAQGRWTGSRGITALQKKYTCLSYGISQNLHD